MKYWLHMIIKYFVNEVLVGYDNKVFVNEVLVGYDNKVFVNVSLFT